MKIMRMRSDESEDKIDTTLKGVTYSTGLKTPGDYRSYYTIENESVFSTNSASKRTNRSMTDWLTSGYKSRSQRGEIISNPCDSSITKVDNRAYGYLREDSYLKLAQSMSPDPGDIPLVRTGFKIHGTEPSSVLLGDPSNPNTFRLGIPSCNVGQMEQLAVTNAHARIDTSDAAALVTIGELNETIDFLQDSVKRLIKIYKAVRKLDLKSLSKQISKSELAKRYLEYRYAIRPTISEIDTYFQALVNQSKPKRYTYRAVEDFLSTTVSPEYLCYTDWQANYYAKEYVSRIVTVRAGVLCAIDVNKLDKWGFTKPFDAAWDLIPLSFIADWVFNIGNTIASFSPELGIEQLTSWCSTTDIVRREKKLTRVSLKPDSKYLKPGRRWIMNCSGAEISRETKNYKRVINPKLSILPTFRLRLDKLKVLDLALILKQMCSEDNIQHRLGRQFYTLKFD